MFARTGWLYPLVIAAVLAGSSALRVWDPLFLQTLRALGFDVYQRLEPAPVNPNPPVRVIAIDATSIERVGPWPWPPAVLARLVERLRDQSAVVVALDMRLADPDAADSLAAALGAGPTVLSITPTNRASDDVIPLPMADFIIVADDPLPFIPGFANVVANQPPFDAEAAGIGAALTGIGGRVRRLPLMTAVGDKMIPALAMEVLRVAQGADIYVIDASAEDDWSTLGRPHGVLGVAVGDIDVPTDPGGSIRLHLRSTDPSSYVAAWQVLEGSAAPDRIAGRIAIVGLTDPAIANAHPTPLEVAAPAVAIHAQAIENILTGQTLTRPRHALAIEISAVVVVGLVLAFLIGRLRLVHAVLASLIVVGLVVAAGWYAFRDFSLVMDPTWPALSLWVMAALGILVLQRRLELRRREIRAAFGHALSPTVVDAILAHPGRLVLTGETRQLTLMSCKVRDFRTIARQLEAQELIGFVNRLYRPVSRAVLDHRGTIAQNTGDTIQAFWNAPLADEAHAVLACEAAIEVAAAVRQFDTLAREEAGTVEGEQTWVALGLGLTTGDCVVGNLGTGDRFDYLAIGENMDLATQIQRRCAVYGVAIVVGEATVRNLAEVRVLELDLVRVEGRSRPTRLYTLADAVAGAAGAFDRLSPVHGEMITAFRNRDWDAADGALAECRSMRVAGLATLYSLYRTRIATFREIRPPPNWDGTDATALK
ncbi:MAG: adenylate/guanylate cyclase domain-containing protein [Hyphomicrobiales bacterium]|nr:adenylate/guanylate cyclase domain-containing protein [Hyphomicrobiales bacterium]